MLTLLRMGAFLGALLIGGCADGPSPLYSQALQPDTAQAPIRIVVLAREAVTQVAEWWDADDVYQNEKAMCVKHLDYSEGFAQGRPVRVFVVSGFMPAKIDSATPIRIHGLSCPGPTIHTHPPTNCQEVEPGTGNGRGKSWSCTPNRWREKLCYPSDSTNTRDGSPGDVGGLNESGQPFGLLMCGPQSIGFYFPTRAPNAKALPVIPNQHIKKVDPE